MKEPLSMYERTLSHSKESGSKTAARVIVLQHGVVGGRIFVWT